MSDLAEHYTPFDLTPDECEHGKESPYRCFRCLLIALDTYYEAVKPQGKYLSAWRLSRTLVEHALEQEQDN